MVDQNKSISMVGTRPLEYATGVGFAVLKKSGPLKWWSEE